MNVVFGSIGLGSIKKRIEENVVLSSIEFYWCGIDYYWGSIEQHLNGCFLALRFNSVVLRFNVVLSSIDVGLIMCIQHWCIIRVELEYYWVASGSIYTLSEM